MRVTTPHGAVRLAANLKWLFTEVPFERRFEAAAAAGFEAVEIASPYGLPATRVRELADEAGVRTVLINTPAGPAGSPTSMGAGFAPEAREEFRRGLLTALDYASALGAPTIHAMAGLRPAGVGEEAAFATYVANIGWAAERARTAGVRLALEPINKRDQPTYGLATMESAAAVTEATDPDTVGILFDVYHAQIDGGDLITRLRRLRPRVAHIQVADNPGRGEPGSGEIAYPAVFAAIADAGYDGWVGCEYRPVSTTQDGLGWIERMSR